MKGKGQVQVVSYPLRKCGGSDVQNIVQFTEALVVETARINGFSAADWATLAQYRKVTTPWAKDFGELFTKTLYSDPETSKLMEKVNRSDQQQAFAIWYETLVSGSPGQTFWPETCLIGLFHASAGVANRHVIGMLSRLEIEFLRRCLASIDAKGVGQLYLAFKRVLGIAQAIMVDSYHFANIAGMKDVGVNEALFARIRGLSIRKMIEEARTVLPLIEWNDSLSVEIDSIDDQHKKLLEILNALHDPNLLSQGPEKVQAILNELVEYTVYHFNHEEELMRRHQYPDIENHLAAHRTLVEQVGKFQADFQAGKAKLSGELFKFLRSWLNGHIRGTDKLYSPHLRGCGVV